MLEFIIFSVLLVIILNTGNEEDFLKSIRMLTYASLAWPLKLTTVYNISV